MGKEVSVKPIYLDYAATTPVDPLVLNEMINYMTLEGCFGNAASMTHCYGWDADKAVKNARRQVAQVINAQPQEIIWTSGATEADNLAIQGVAQAYKEKGLHFITVKTEHKAVLDSFQALEKRGCEVTYLNVQKNGLIDLQELTKALRPDTVLVSIMHVNNEIGVIHDIAAISKIVHQNNALLHVDASQSVGKIVIDVEAMQIDLLSLSAHKAYGPKGIGALYIRQKPRVRVIPLIYGGNHERGYRSGTLATHQIVGMGKAFELVHGKIGQEARRVAALREQLWAEIVKLEGIHCNGDMIHSVPHILNISVEGVNGEALLIALKEIAVSNGSACNSHTNAASHVLLALGVPQELAQSSLRISLGRFTTEEQIQHTVEVVSRVVRHLRKMSPY